MDLTTRHPRTQRTAVHGEVHGATRPSRRHSHETTYSPRSGRGRPERRTPIRPSTTTSRCSSPWASPRTPTGRCGPPSRGARSASPNARSRPPC